MYRFPRNRTRTDRACLTKLKLPTLLTVLLIISGSSAFAADRPTPVSDQLEVSAIATGHGLHFNSAEPFYTTTNAIVNQRTISVPDSATRLILWDEVDDSGTTTPFYAISLNGNKVQRVLKTSYGLKLRNRPFEPFGPQPAAPIALAADANTEAYIVQFITQPLAVMQAQVEDLGGELCRYLPNNAFIARLSPAAREAVAELPYVRWIGPYHPEYRLERPLLNALTQRAPQLGQRQYAIQVMRPDWTYKGPVIAEIERIGGTVDAVGETGSVFVATLTQNQLERIVRLDEVLHISRKGDPVTTMDKARELNGADYIETVAGYTGLGVRGEVMDNGCQTDHPAYASRLSVRRPGSVESHGTATVGINFGDGWASPSGRGLLPDAEGVFSVWGTTGFRVDDTGQLVTPTWQCVYQSNSWGTSPFTTEYNDTSAEMDEAVFEHDILIVQAHGNYGTTETLGETWAKNVLSIGGVIHNDTLTRSDDGWYGHASIGPASDFRIKPDLCNFYDNIRTTINYDTYTDNFGGTSGATPITAGHCGLFFQMWADGIFGNPVSGGSVFDERPHSSTARAMMINTAMPYDFSGAGADLSRMHQGWGMANVQRLYDWRDNTFVIDETDVIQPLETATYEFRIQSGEPYHDQLRITLVYLDYPGTASASQHRINDLSLRVTSPGGSIYYGNYGLREGNWSNPGGELNTIDTVENVFIDDPQTGIWTVEVIGSEIVIDTHVETQRLDADFALVVTGGEAWADCNANGINDYLDVAGGTSEDCNLDEIPDECQLVDNDCNTNGIPDDCDVADGASLDCNLDGVPDECQLGPNDCNANGIPDDCDLVSGFSTDCNADDIPDECQLVGNDCNANGIPDDCDVADGNSSDCNANGVPDECDLASGTEDDCNSNGIPDSCDLSPDVNDASGELIPLGVGYTQTHTLTDPPPASSPVTLAFRAFGDINLTSEQIDVHINGEFVDVIFDDQVVTSDCPYYGYDVDQIVLTAEEFNLAAAGGTFLIEMIPGNGVDPDKCDPDTWISVTVSYEADASSGDCNANGVPDECDITSGTSTDSDGNGIPDECEADWCLGDMNCSGGAPTFADILYFAAAVGDEAGWVQYYRDNNGGTDPPCPWMLGDYGGGSGVEFSDIVPFANSVGQPCMPYIP